MSDIHEKDEISHSLKFLDRYEWTIHGFYSRAVENILESPDINFAVSTWHLAVWFSENELIKENGWLSVKLYRTSMCGPRCHVSIGIKKKDGKDSRISGGETDSDGFLEVRKFVPLSEIMKKGNKLLSKGGSITIFCEMHREGGEGEMFTPSSVVELVQNLRDLMITKENSDITLKVQDKEFQAHKAILAARCKVFFNMFRHDMAESQTGVVVIPDCSSEAFEAFLLYVYTGKIDCCTSDTAFDLFYAADKYNVNDLKQHCVQFLKNSLSVENFCSIITLALRHNESDLVEASTLFFMQHVKFILKTVQWQKYLEENPVEANELYIRAIYA